MILFSVAMVCNAAVVYWIVEYKIWQLLFVYALDYVFTGVLHFLNLTGSYYFYPVLEATVV